MPVIIKTDLPEGNAYSIMGTVKRLLRDIHGYEKGVEIYAKYQEEATSGDYENLKQASLKHVNGMNVPPLLMFADSSQVVEHIDFGVSEEVTNQNLWWNNEEDDE